MDELKQATKHTPKPWRLSSMFANRVAGERADGEGTFVASCDSNNGDNNAEDEANARLVVAAPDLLWELVRAVEMLDEAHQRGCGAGAPKSMRAAIAKATA